MRKSTARWATAAFLVATLSGTGCSQHNGETPPIPGNTSCPSEITELVDQRQSPAMEIVGVVDGSGSFMGRSGAPAEERARQQVYALVEQAVEQRAALHILVFGTTAATVTDAVVCPTVAARYNNEAAKASKTTYLKEQAGPAVWSAVQVARKSTEGVGTSIVGGWRAASETTALAAQRQVVMLSDGQGRKEADVSVDLSGFGAVGMYSVGSVAGKPGDTHKTVTLVGQWTKWLAAHHASDPVVTTRPFS